MKNTECNTELDLGGKCLPYKEIEFRLYKNAYELFEQNQDLNKKQKSFLKIQ